MTDHSGAPPTGEQPDAVFEVEATVSVCRDTEQPLTEQDRDLVLDRIALAIGDLNDGTYTFIGGVKPAALPDQHGDRKDVGEPTEVDALAKKAVMTLRHAFPSHRTHCECKVCVAVGVLYGYHCIEQGET